MNFATFYRKQKRYAEEGSVYESMAAREHGISALADLYVNAGRAYMNAGQPEEADRVLRKAIGAAPTERRAYELLTAAAYASGGFAAAGEIISTGVENGAPAAFLFLALADAAEKAGNFEESRRALANAAREAEPVSATGMAGFDLYLSIAESSRKAGDGAGRIAALEKAVELNPESAEVLSALGTLHLEQRNLDRSSLYFTKIAELKPDSANAHFQLGMIQEDRYRFGAAEKAYLRAMELAPQNETYRKRHEALRARIAEAKRARSEEPGAAESEAKTNQNGRADRSAKISEYYRRRTE